MKVSCDPALVTKNKHFLIPEVGCDPALVTFLLIPAPRSIVTLG